MASGAPQRRLSLDGRSMWPLAPPCRAILAPPPPTGLQRGDLVAFVGTGPDTIYVHRIVGHSEAGWLTRGDTLVAADPAVPESAVIGRIVAIELGPLRLPLPATGVLARAQRSAGLAWGRLAPRLRVLWVSRRFS